MIPDCLYQPIVTALPVIHVHDALEVRGIHMIEDRPVPELMNRRTSLYADAVAGLFEVLLVLVDIPDGADMVMAVRAAMVSERDGSRGEGAGRGEFLPHDERAGDTYLAPVPVSVC